MNRTLPLLLVTAFLVLSSAVWAAPADDDTVPGELHVNTNSEYVKAEVNGEPWDPSRNMRRELSYFDLFL